MPIGHHFGRRPYPNGAGNLQWLAFLTAGEGLHNNHHAAPTSAKLSHRWFEIDPGWWVVRVPADHPAGQGTAERVAPGSPAPQPSARLIRMVSIATRRVLTASGWRDDCVVHVDAGRITAIEAATVPAPDLVLVPGFVDLQVNGIDDVDVATAEGDAWTRLDRLLVQQGVTTWCPTLVTMPLDRYAAPLERIAEAIARPAAGRPTIAGVHLEGPFLGAAAGAHRPELIVPIDLEWIDHLPPHVRLVTLGAEQPLATEAIARLVQRDVLVSIGHSRATNAEFDAAVGAGARLVTHLFNAMSGVNHRDPGVAVFAMIDRRVGVSIIADGVHVHPAVVRLAFDAIGDRAVLVTDAVAWRSGRWARSPSNCATEPHDCPTAPWPAVRSPWMLPCAHASPPASSWPTWCTQQPTNPPGAWASPIGV